MKWLTYIWLLCILGMAQSLEGQGHFEMTPDMVSAYESVSRLRFEEAHQTIAHIKKTDSENLLIHLVENYVDFFTLFISEEKDQYDFLKKNKGDRIDLIKEGDKTSPYYNFAMAEINLQWATVGLKFGERIGPMRSVYSAYNLLKENQQRYPDFVANNKSLSIIHALSESLPGLVRTLFNVKGSIEQGTQEIAGLAAYSDEHDDFIFREEVYAIYAYILFYQNNEREKAYQVLKEADLPISESPLLCFLMANITQKTGRTDEALAVLDDRPTGADYFQFDYLEFMYGKFLLYQLDSSAVDHMEVFLQNFNGRHFIKEAYQKMAWYALAAEGDIVKYKSYMAKCTEEGYSLVDEDKQALQEAKNKSIPNMTLLQARLLYDGGYYQDAYKKLVLQSHQLVDDEQFHIEFNYRMARVLQALGNPSEAITYYLETINVGEQSSSYYACNSALQIAIILEDQQQYKKALQLYERCLRIEPNEYQASLHQKAKSGKERVRLALKNQ